MPFGSGAQWMSWIHRDDLIDLFLFVLDQETLAGPLNATAPTPVRHAELMEAIAVSLGRRLWPVNIPAKLLRRVLGELAQLFVDGQRVTPDRALALGFHFRYATIGAALAATLQAPRGKRREPSTLSGECPEAASKTLSHPRRTSMELVKCADSHRSVSAFFFSQASPRSLTPSPWTRRASESSVVL